MLSRCINPSRAMLRRVVVPKPNPLSFRSQPSDRLGGYKLFSNQTCGNVQKVFINTCKQESKLKPKPKIDPISMTETAAQKIKYFVESEGKSPSEYGLQVGIEKSGCSGSSYSMELGSLSSAKENGDEVFQNNGAHVIIAKKNMLTVFGSILDYKESFFASGFEFDNPNIAKSCGCGSSFRVKKG